MTTGPCLCGDPWCPSCGRAMGTYPEPYPGPDTDELYERDRQAEIDRPTNGQDEAVDKPGPI